MRQEKLKEFKLGMKKQQFMFTKVSQESEAAVHASYVLSEMIAKHSKPFTEGDFIKECLIKAAEIVCPGTTDGAPSMTGKTNGFVALLRKKLSEISDGSNIHHTHCLIHQEVLCTKVIKMENVLTPIKKFINFIRSRGLNQRQFSLFLTELESEYSGLSYYTEVRWLSCSKVLKQFWDLKEEICQFLITKNQDITLFSDQVWLQDFSFMVDITKHLSDLNLKLQGKDQIITNMCDQVNAFKCFVRALRWKDESSGMCCSNGKVRLPLIELPPEPLRSLLSGENSDSVHFLRNIRKYNSCFQMTSFGAETQTHSVTFPTTFSIQGQVYHRIGSLMPSENQPSRFLQIYFVGNDDDDDIQTDRRCQQKREVVVNADRTPPGQHPRRYNAPTANEVAVVLAGNQFGSRDIVLHQRDNLLKHVSDTQRFYDALQYPLIFWKGQEGYSFHIPQIDPNTRQPLSSKVSSMDFYGYVIMVRRNSPNVIVQFGQLFYQFLVDMYAKVESERLRYITLHQRNLRAESYIHLRDALSTDANINPNSLGQRIILPSSFVNSPRYLAEYTQDAFCYVRKFGRPDLFITFSSNPSWEELSAALLPGQKQLDRHDITARVFRQKLVKFIGALTKGQLYGATVAWMYSVEWQKRGLPHAHILVWLANKLRPTQIDSVICAEFPDPIQDPLLYNIVVKNMIHGPCGEYNPVSPCMENSSCSKKYPKQFLLETQTNVLQARILTGSFRGEEVLIPRIPIIPNNLPLKFRRLQFPVMVAFAMTINKSQGQTLQVVGVHLESPCFSHGQLYVACSRVSSPKNVFVFSSTFSKTRNIVYQGALI
ncbi:hypothetical protein LAZ67_19001160 [Cordylochernes scorpioides]|uniref:Helitron helicase-like domain-containing protein n=1 Tax=Cordylochernes scorpioides TaxID=51811 RepID=A0ABY6LHR3_9ARAC|nr:hypothetical protein LAZ67_19001160 [Cordylochernes scorpioides]